MPFRKINLTVEYNDLVINLNHIFNYKNILSVRKNKIKYLENRKYNKSKNYKKNFTDYKWNVISDFEKNNYSTDRNFIKNFTKASKKLSLYNEDNIQKYITKIENRILFKNRILKITNHPFYRNDLENDIKRVCYFQFEDVQIYNIGKNMEYLGIYNFYFFDTSLIIYDFDEKKIVENINYSSIKKYSANNIFTKINLSKKNYYLRNSDPYLIKIAFDRIFNII